MAKDQDEYHSLWIRDFEHKGRPFTMCAYELTPDELCRVDAGANVALAVLTTCGNLWGAQLVLDEIQRVELLEAAAVSIVMEGPGFAPIAPLVMEPGQACDQVYPLAHMAIHKVGVSA